MTAHTRTASRILVVEDESLIAMLIEDLLLDLGYEVVGPVARVERALDLIEREAIDGALLDVNLGVERSYPIADALSARNCPFVFTTGYGEAGLAPAHCGRPVLRKPLTRDGLEEALATHVDAQRRSGVSSASR